MDTATFRPIDRLEHRTRPLHPVGAGDVRHHRAGLLVVLVVIGRTTEWGRQFWRITGDYFNGRQSVPVWAMLALLLLTIVSVRISVLLSYYDKDLFTALQVAFQPVDRGSGRARILVDHGGVRRARGVLRHPVARLTCT